MAVPLGSEQLEGDYVRSQLYGSGQNNFQVVAAVNYRF
jgi:hypothetical protein